MSKPEMNPAAFGAKLVAFATLFGVLCTTFDPQLAFNLALLASAVLGSQ